MNQKDLINTIIVMARQAETAYITKKGLYELSASVDADSRRKMCDWSIRIADFCHFSRATVDIAFNYLDRYASKKPQVLEDRASFQLLSMTCLYTAIKVHEEEAMTPVVMAKLSHGMFSEQDIEQAERDVLQTIEWRMNPPTANAFAEAFLELVPQTEQSAELKPLIQRQVDYAISETSFMGTSSAIVALSAVCNAMSCVAPEQYESYLKSVVAQEIGIASSPEIEAELMSRIGEYDCRPSKLERSPSKRLSSTGDKYSPRSVSTFE